MAYQRKTGKLSEGAIGQIADSAVSVEDPPSSVQLITRTVSFRARQSILDREYLHNGVPLMRGFLVLFWITISLYAALSMYRNSAKYFMGVSLRFWNASYRDFEALFVMIGAIYLYTYVALLYQWLLLWNVFNIKQRSISRKIAMQLLELGPIFMSLFVANYRDWPPLQTGSLLLFSISMNMKIHSFLITNEALDFQYKASRREKSNSTSVSYPKNLTVNHFTLYLWFPTLIYQLEYPRTEKIRWPYLIERTFGISAIFCLFYVILSHHVHPIVIKINEISLCDAFMELILPCLASALLVFFLIFEYILNWAAEITRFADRQFYSDWWNSTDMAEFARKWNIPVHRFLRLHVFTELREQWNFSSKTAQFLTFLYSSILHELVVSSTAKKLSVWMLLLQMSQIPLMIVSRWLNMGVRPFLANCIWWLMIILGVPLIVLLYARDNVITIASLPFFPWDM